jgi:hypothetical protein
MLAEGWLTASDAAQIKEHAAMADVPPSEHASNTGSH